MLKIKQVIIKFFMKLQIKNKNSPLWIQWELRLLQLLAILEIL